MISQLPLFSDENKPKANNSGFMSEDDEELARSTRGVGYDLERPARVYSVSEALGVTNLWKVSTRDAMRICRHPKSCGKMYGREWFYCWTQHDVEGCVTNRAGAFKDDGRLANFEGLEDIKILGVY